MRPPSCGGQGNHGEISRILKLRPLSAPGREPPTRWRRADHRLMHERRQVENGDPGTCSTVPIGIPLGLGPWRRRSNNPSYPSASHLSRRRRRCRSLIPSVGSWILDRGDG